MPQARSKPSDIAAEAKRIFFLEAEKRCPNLPAKSIFYQDASKLVVGPGTVQKRKLRVAVIDGDPLDVALDWHEHNLQSGVQNMRNPGPQTIPIVNMANEKRAGGDWESGLMAPEECLCRRSNLVQALKTPYNSNPPMSHYPIPRFGVIYSPHVGKWPRKSLNGALASTTSNQLTPGARSDFPLRSRRWLCSVVQIQESPGHLNCPYQAAEAA